MRTSLGTCLVALLLTALGACGEDTGDGSGATGSQEPAPSGTPEPEVELFPGCRAADPSTDAGTVLAAPDVDGDGAADEVRLTPPGAGACGDALVVRTAGSAGGLALDGVALTADTAEAVTVPGRDGELLLVRETHPRGGFQVHLYGWGDDGFAEVLVGGQTLVPFIATDVSESPTTMRCTENGDLEVLAARTHKPPGIVFAWDLFRTTFAVDGTDAQVVESGEIRDNYLDEDLRREMPELFGWQMLENCP